MFSRIILFALIFIFSVFSLPAKAQEQHRLIEYGQTVNGNISDKDFEVKYDFNAKKGEVFVIEMKTKDRSTLAKPQIIIVASNGDVIADASSNVALGSAYLVGQKMVDDTVTIIATRKDGRSGDGIGDFTLNLISPTLLNVDVPIKETIINNISQYYRINVGTSALKLSYMKFDNGFSPEVSINVINDTHGLTSIISLSGKALSSIQTDLPMDEGIYIVKIGKNDFNLNVDEAEVKYQFLLSEYAYTFTLH